MQKYLIKIIAILIAISCAFFFFKKMNNSEYQNDSIMTADKSPQQKAQNTTLPDDFRDFYNRFHTDSIFQLDRVIFPINAIVQEGDTVLTVVEKQLNRDTWTIHKPYDDRGGTFERTFQYQDNIISERITAQGGLFSVEKRYAKLAGDWFLIYYQGLVMHG